MASSKQIGAAGEELAASYLKRKGYRILERNYRWRRGEIDVVAEKERIMVFVEVKTARQPFFGAPESWVDEHKQRQIGRAAQHYLFEREIADVDCRFDVIAITRERGRWNVEHIENAFWLESGS